MIDIDSIFNETDTNPEMLIVAPPVLGKVCQSSLGRIFRLSKHVFGQHPKELDAERVQITHAIAISCPSCTVGSA
jgi:hypothetical protein